MPLQILRAGGGELNLYEILVGYYMEFGEVHTRAYVGSAMARLKKQGLVVATGKRGEFRLVTSNEDLDKDE